MRLIKPTSNHRIPIVDIDFHELEVQNLSAQKIIVFAEEGKATSEERNGRYFSLWLPSARFPRLYSKEEVEEAVDAYQ